MHERYLYSWWGCYGSWVFLLTAAIAFPVAQIAHAADAGDEVQVYLRSIGQLYQDLEYERALEQIGRAKRLARGVEDDVALALYEGIIFSELNRRQEAAAAFRAALLLRPEVKLPVLVSPKMRRHFEALREQVKKDLSIKSGKRPEERRQAKTLSGIGSIDERPVIIDRVQSATQAKAGDTISFRVGVKNSQSGPFGFSWSASMGTLGRWESTAAASSVIWTAPACVPAGGALIITATVTSTHGFSSSNSFRVNLACPGLSPIASMSVMRRQHTASLLSLGKVLIVGGEGGGSNRKPVASAEIYDPGSGTWAATGPMSFARRFHTASILLTGKVLAVGGHSGDAYLGVAEVYDPVVGAWDETGNMAFLRAHHTASVLLSGKVLVTGGYNGSSVLATAEVYDPDKRKWETVKSMGFQRAYHTASVLPSGKVLVAGGDSGGKALATAELYDPEFGTWTTLPSMSSARRHHTASVLPSGRVLVVGGDNGSRPLATAELYDPGTGLWTPAGNMNSARQYHAASVLPSGKVLVTGGRGRASLNTVEEYDPATGTWKIIGLMTSARQEHTSNVLPSGELLVVGGAIDLSTLATAEKYTP